MELSETLTAECVTFELHDIWYRIPYYVLEDLVIEQPEGDPFADSLNIWNNRCEKSIEILKEILKERIGELRAYVLWPQSAMY